MRRRGTILLTVLIVVAMASLTGATAMYIAGAQVTSARVTLKRAQSRALAWSGVQAVMAELAAQREDLLDGQTPRLTEEWELYEEGGNRAVIRLIAMHGEDEPVLSEAGRININTATVEMLTSLGFEQSAAQAIVDERASRPWTSVEDLLRLPGVSASLLTGIGTDSEGLEQTAGLEKLVTVWSFDPNIQSGVGEGASRHRGMLRVNLDLPWSDKLASAIDDRFGEGASRAVKTLVDQGTKFKSMGDISRALQRLSIEPREWAPVFDAFTMSDDPYLPGKVDLMVAPVAVLQAIPGINKEAAEQIVQTRASLDREATSSIAWPVVEGVLTPEQFAQAADHLTTRTMQWRVRIEAGLVAPSDRFSESSKPPLSSRIVVEAVIDIASERPQVAYLRDITMQNAATRLYQSLLGGESSEAEAPELSLDSLLPPFEDGEAVARSSAPAPLRLGATDIPGLRLPGLNPRPSLRSSGLNLRDRSAAEAPNPAGSGDGSGDLDFGTMNFDELDFGGRDRQPAASSIDYDGLFADPEEHASESGVDRRVGRWTTGKRGGTR